MKIRIYFVLFLLLHTFSGFGQDFNKLISQSADTLARKMAATGKKRVAIVDFINLDKSITQLGSLLREEISSEMSNFTNGQFKVLERGQLEQILKEKELLAQYYDGPGVAMELGRLSVSDVLIFGIITEMEGDGYYRLSMSLLDTKDGDKLGAYKINIPKTNSLDALNKKVIKSGISFIPSSKDHAVPSEPEPEPQTIFHCQGGGNAESVQYGGGKFCTYTIDIQNILFSFDFNSEKFTISNVLVNNDAKENSLNNCPFPSIASNKHQYFQKSIRFEGRKVEIDFEGWGEPKCNVTFSGWILPDNTRLDGTLRWHRIDQISPLDFTVGFPISVYLQ